ncbi:MAG TPA: hypothetical protein VH761_03770, partial [Ilumatobacteraceae bacterium]
MYDNRSGHSAKKRNRDDPNELNRAGRRGSVVVVPFVFGRLPGVDVVVDGDADEVVGEAGSLGAECSSSP